MQRKPTRQSRGANAAEKKHMKWIKERSICAACKNSAPVINHHCMGATFKHDKTHVGHWFVIGLCVPCDNLVTRGSRRALTDAFGSQSALWLRQAANYNEQIPDEVVRAIESWGK